MYLFQLKQWKIAWKPVKFWQLFLRNSAKRFYQNIFGVYQTKSTIAYAVTPFTITWRFLRAVLIKNVENFENIIYSDHEEWPLKAKEKVQNGLMKILEEKYHDLELRRGFENFALEKFYECQRNILKKFMCELKMNKIYEI